MRRRSLIAHRNSATLASAMRCSIAITIGPLRGMAERRQVDGTRLGLQRNLGVGGACIVTLYERI